MNDLDWFCQTCNEYVNGAKDNGRSHMTFIHGVIKENERWFNDKIVYWSKGWKRVAKGSSEVDLWQ